MTDSWIIRIDTNDRDCPFQEEVCLCGHEGNKDRLCNKYSCPIRIDDEK